MIFQNAPIQQAIKPTVLIGTSGVGKTFTREVVETMASLNEVDSLLLPPPLYSYMMISLSDIKLVIGMQKPLILALSNPTSQSECTAEEAYAWSKVINPFFLYFFLLFSL